MTIVGYIFLEQKDDLLRQRDFLDTYAKTKGWEIDHFRVERDESIRRPFLEREKGGDLAGQLKEGDVVLVEKSFWVLASARAGLHLLARLRERQVSLYCADIGGNLSMPEKRKVTVSEGPADLVLKLIEALSLCESSHHGESIRAAKALLKKEGKYLGGPVPFGWKVQAGFLVRDEEQQGKVAEMEELRKNRWSYRAIADEMKKRHGFRFSHEGIRKILSHNKRRN